MQEEFTSQQEELRRALSQKGLDGFVALNDELSNWQAIAHQTGFYGTCGLYFLPCRGEGEIFFDGRYLERAKSEITNCRVLPFEDDFAAKILEVALSQGARKIAMQAHRTSADQWLAVSRALEEKGITLTPFDDEFEEICSVKTVSEIAKIKSAAALATEAFFKALEGVREGMTEASFAAALEYQMAIRGAKAAFDTIVASGVNSSVPHAYASEKQIRRGEIVTVDFGARLDNYVCDITRNFVIGSATSEQKDLHNLIKNAHIASASAVVAGASGKAIQEIAEGVFGDKREFFTHSLGHGIGLFIHELPRLSYRKDYTLKANQVVTVEPGLYFPSKFGMRLEDDYLVTDGTPLRLTESMPQELFEI